MEPIGLLETRLLASLLVTWLLAEVEPVAQLVRQPDVLGNEVSTVLLRKWEVIRRRYPVVRRSGLRIEVRAPAGTVAPLASRSEAR